MCAPKIGTIHLYVTLFNGEIKVYYSHGGGHAGGGHNGGGPATVLSAR
jgi:hypothetical protein